MCWFCQWAIHHTKIQTELVKFLTLDSNGGMRLKEISYWIQ